MTMRRIIVALTVLAVSSVSMHEVSAGKGDESTPQGGVQKGTKSNTTSTSSSGGKKG